MIIFLVGNNVQLANALSVSKFLEPGNSMFLDLWTGQISAAPPEFTLHTPAVTLRRAIKIFVGASFGKNDIIVLPQDVGLLQRLVAGRAKKSGATTVLLPDGVVSAEKVPNGSAFRRTARSTLDAVMRAMHLVQGRAGEMGSSSPDYILSWGRGWDKAFASGLDSHVLHLGCPRMDGLAHLAPTNDSGDRRILICSQPLNIPSWSKAYASSWYSFLQLALRLERNGFEVRVRLHPAEESDPSVPADIVRAFSPRPLADDIEWSTIVMAPFSTVLVEALAAGRAILALTSDEYFSSRAKQYPFFRDERVNERQWGAKALDWAPSEDNDMAGLQDDFITGVGTSGLSIAGALISMEKL